MAESGDFAIRSMKMLEQSCNYTLPHIYRNFVSQTRFQSEFPSMRIGDVEVISDGPIKYLKVNVQKTVGTSNRNKDCDTNERKDRAAQEVAVRGNDVIVTRTFRNNNPLPTANEPSHLSLERDLAALSMEGTWLKESHLNQALAVVKFNEPEKFAKFCVVKDCHCVLLSNRFSPDGSDVVIYDSALRPYTEEDWKLIFRQFPGKTVISVAFAFVQQQTRDNCGLFMMLSYFAVVLGFLPQDLVFNEGELRPLLTKFMSGKCHVDTLMVAFIPEKQRKLYLELTELPSTTNLSVILGDSGINLSRYIGDFLQMLDDITKQFENLQISQRCLFRPMRDKNPKNKRIGKNLKDHPFPLTNQRMARDQLPRKTPIRTGYLCIPSLSCKGNKVISDANFQPVLLKPIKKIASRTKKSMSQYRETAEQALDLCGVIAINRLQGNPGMETWPMLIAKPKMNNCNEDNN